MSPRGVGSDGPRRAAHRVSGAGRGGATLNDARTATLEGVLAAALLLGALLLGGGTRSFLFSDLSLQFIAIPVLLFGLYRHANQRMHRAAREWFTLVAAIACLPLLFLLPLPQAIWAWLPGRDAIADMHVAHGISDAWWAPLSLDRTATWAALRSFLPALALALLVPLLDLAWRRRLLYLVVLAGVFTVPLGLAQLNGGAESPLRFYRPTNVLDAVGLFANRNHFAALLVSALALTGGFLIEDLSRTSNGQDYGRLRRVVWVLLAGVLIYGLALSRSRAGVGLALVAMAGCAWLAWRQLGGKALRWVAIGAGIALLLGFQVGFLWMVERAQQMLAGDHRWQILGASLDLARAFGWMGVGPGAFPAAYAAYEPLQDVGAKIVNHAHNDWLEWWLEIGFLFPLLVLMFGRWLYRSTREVLALAGASPVSPLFLQGAWLVIPIAILHAGFDYQLRTTTDLCILVVCCACLVPSREALASRPSRSSPRLATAHTTDGTGTPS